MRLETCWPSMEEKLSKEAETTRRMIGQMLLGFNASEVESALERSN